MTVQSVDSDEPDDKQKLTVDKRLINKSKLFVNEPKFKTWFANQILHREALKTNFPDICHRSFKQTRM